MPPGHQLIDDEISRAAFDLLLKEPFYAHVLAGMPRVITDQVKSMGLRWNGQQVVLQVNPEWFRKGLAATQRKVALKHEVLHIVFRHLFRPGDRDARIYSIAADLVVNQLLDPLKPLPGWPTLEMFPELKLKPDQQLDVYYGALAMLLRQMQKAGFGGVSGPDGEGQAKGNRRGKSGEAADWAKAAGKPQSAEALAELLAGSGNAGSGKRGDDGGWHDGQDGIGAPAGRYAVGSVLIRARERMPPHQWGSLPAALLSELALILAERQPKLDWKRVVRIFCASSGSSRIRHTMKRISKRYGTRPGIKVQRMQRLLVAVDTSCSIDQEMLEAFFTEIHAAWKAGATVHIVECDAEVQRDYKYAGKPPRDIAGGGGTEFEPVFRWMADQSQFDGLLYLTDGYGPAPTTRPRCKLLWVITGGDEDAGDQLPFGPTVPLQID
jgi:predicted metal-dependent peptidase